MLAACARVLSAARGRGRGRGMGTYDVGKDVLDGHGVVPDERLRRAWMCVYMRRVWGRTFVTATMHGPSHARARGASRSAASAGGRKTRMRAYTMSNGGRAVLGRRVVYCTGRGSWEEGRRAGTCRRADALGT